MSYESRKAILKDAKKLAKETNDTEMVGYLKQFNPSSKGFPLSCFLKVVSWMNKKEKEISYGS